VTDSDILAAFADIVYDVARIDPALVTPDKRFVDDFDIDSLSMVEIATAAEDKFGVSIPDSALTELKTVGDAVAFIEKAGVAA
jgi:acyl carrier protein